MVSEIEVTPTNGAILPKFYLEWGVAFGDTEILVLYKIYFSSNLYLFCSFGPFFSCTHAVTFWWGRKVSHFNVVAAFLSCPTILIIQYHTKKITIKRSITEGDSEFVTYFLGIQHPISMTSWFRLGFSPLDPIIVQLMIDTGAPS